MAQGGAIVGILIAAGHLKNPLPQQLLIAMVRIASIARVIECLSKTSNHADLGFNLTKQQHTAVAAHGAPIEISLQVFTAKSCKGQHNLLILGHGGFLFLLQSLFRAYPF
jgi:hypothetical protein